MRAHLGSALVLLLVFIVLTGVVYPLAVTGIAQLAFPDAANGSLIRQGGRVVGSRLIGQAFSDPRHFWGRLSATSPAYNASASSGSNLGPLNPAPVDAAKARIAKLQAADPGNGAPIPVDLVTASASGLDPQISIAAARWQIPRVARSRGLSPDVVDRLVDQATEPRQLRFLGEPRVNVVELNLALDALR